MNFYKGKLHINRKELKMKKILNNKRIGYVIIAILGAILSIQLIKMNVHDRDDGFFHILRIIGTKYAISDGNVIPLIAPYFCRDFGYAINIFYQPLVTYIPLLISLFTNTNATALKIFAGLTIILSGIFMYKFIYNVTKSKIASFLAGLVYMAAPYHLTNIYARYAMGEFAGMVFIPLVFLGLQNLFDGDGKKHYYISIGAIGLLLSHTITSFYTAIIGVIYILYHVRAFKKKDVWRKCILNLIFTIAITLFFFLPLLEHNLSADYTIFSKEMMRTSTKYLPGKGTPIHEFFAIDTEKESLVVFEIGTPILLLMIVSLFSLKKMKKEYKDLYYISLILSLLSIYMSTDYFPWKLMPDVFGVIQYQWRMQTFFVLFSSVMIGIGIATILNNYIKDKNVRYIIITAITILVVISSILSIEYMSADRREYRSNTRETDEIYEKEILDKKVISHFSINRDYLPKNATLKQSGYVNKRENRVYILSGNAIIENEEKHGLNLKFDVSNINNNTILELPYFYYLPYKINLEKKDGTIKKLTFTESENGFIQIELNPEDEGKIVFEYSLTNIEKISYIISATSFAIFIIYLIKQKQVQKNENDNIVERKENENEKISTKL